MAWFVYGTVVGGRPLLRGPYPTRQHAETAENLMGDDVIDSNTVWLPTNDPARATRILKERRVFTYGIVKGTTRFKHR